MIDENVARREVETMEWSAGVARASMCGARRWPKYGGAAFSGARDARATP
jgi:hypothetical protein